MRPRIIDDAPLAALNSFGVAARARRLVVLDDIAGLPEALAATAGFGPPLVLGGGSNILFAGDVEGAVLLVRTRGRRLDDAVGMTRLTVAAGESWDELVGWSLDQGFGGLENLAMIPGSCGAAAIQNIGAYGLELAERFESLLAADLGSGALREFSLADCHFGYRDSVFKQPGGDRWLILELRLRVGAFAPVLDYADLRRVFPEGGPTPEAAAIADAVRGIRARKLPDPARLGNAGSFFKNPVIGVAQAGALKEREPGLPLYPTLDARGEPAFKVPAGWLIERCGWKGTRAGDAGVHTDHALVLVNHGTASGAEILALARRIRTSVHARFGIRLEAEPRIVGATDGPD
jgi:UDP-N-acetylmuramate dehydrogenase